MSPSPAASSVSRSTASSLRISPSAAVFVCSIASREQRTASSSTPTNLRPPTGLEHGHRDRVRNHVVQLAGDSGTLCGHRAAGTVLLVTAQQLGVGLELVLSVAAKPHDDAHGPRRPQEGDSERDIAGVVRALIDHERGDEGNHHTEAQPRLKSPCPASQRVDRGQHQEREADGLVFEARRNLLHELDRDEHQNHHHHRQPPAEQQQETCRDPQRDRERQTRVVPAQQLHRIHRRERGDQHAVAVPCPDLGEVHVAHGRPNRRSRGHPQG